MFLLPRHAAFDLFEAFQLVFRANWRRNVTAWIYVPIGITMILLACFAVDSLIGLSSISFPASVAVMILLFCGLLLFERVLGRTRTSAILAVIEVPTGFALRYINVFFIPSFVLLPLSPSISGVEVGKIIAVFLIGFVAMMAITAYLTRGLQVLFGSKKRAMTERAEELGRENDSIPLVDASRNLLPAELDASPSSNWDTPSTSRSNSIAALLLPPARAQDPSQIRATGGPPECWRINRAAVMSRAEVQQQTPSSLTRSQRWAALINANFDRLTYLSLLLIVGVPVYYIANYAMPLQLIVSVLAYFAALALPVSWRKVLHPVLVASLAIVLVLWAFGLTKGNSLDSTLLQYKTGTKYLQLWEPHKGNLQAPGAGDIFSTVLDASIVALAIPMFQYRQELRSHFWAIVLPNIGCSLGMLFGYPPICYALGINAEISLAFAGRSLTLALARPAIQNLGGDLNTVSALAIMSGIAGALVGPRMLNWLRIPEDDYVTRGVTLGGNSSAIATAVLLVTDPRAAALSSLSMSLFGIITVALTSVPPVVVAIRSLVGL